MTTSKFVGGAGGSTWKEPGLGGEGGQATGLVGLGFVVGLGLGFEVGFVSSHLLQ